MKVCIRTANRPKFLNRLLESIAQHEWWLLDYEIEVSDGSHDPSARSENRRICRNFSVNEGRGAKATWIDAISLPHADFCMKSLGLDATNQSYLKGGYNLWQIFQRHQGREIVLLDDDMIFPLMGAIVDPINPSCDEWVADLYSFGNTDEDQYIGYNTFYSLIREARGNRCNTLQLCTRGHGVTDDYSWLDLPEIKDRIVGDPYTSTEITYVLNHPRVIRQGFLTPAWIGCVPKVDVLPPDSKNDDTIALMVHDFGNCFWSNLTINHQREEPKDFSKSVVTDADIVGMARSLFGAHRRLSVGDFSCIINLFRNAKRKNHTARNDTGYTLFRWINEVMKNPDRQKMVYEPEK